MIYTVTLNPAIDYVLTVDELKVGNIHRTNKANVYFGGKGINVSTVLAQLGVSSVATGFVAGFTGKAVENGISSEYIKSDFVTLETGLTRINVKIRSGYETDINCNGPEISGSDIEKLFSKLETLKKGDILVLAGSIPDTLPRDIYSEILRRLDGRGICFAVDAEKQLLLNCLKYKPFLIKPNAEELGQLFDTAVKNSDDALKYAEKLQKSGAVNVLVSLGEEGAVLLDENGCVHRENAHNGRCVNTVGAGDSTVAGFIAGYLESGGDYGYALKLGNAAGGATAFSEGLAKKEQILALLNL